MLEFAQPLARLQGEGPNPLGYKILWTLFVLLGALGIWATFGRLDIVAVAEGKLIPESHLKIVQPAEGGIVSEILVREGQNVATGQVLMRMDSLLSEADSRSIEAEYLRKRLALRRIAAELEGRAFRRESSDPESLASEIEAQYRANRNALQAALAEERSWFVKARHELAAAEQVKKKLEEMLPHYREQDKAFARLAKDGFAGPLLASDKRREYLEKEQELQTQIFLIESARASMEQSEKKLAQIESDYRRQLHAERNEIQAQLEKLEEEVVKQAYRRQLLELRAPRDGVVKDLATHTVGTVVQPGTVLLTLVPKDESLRAEVWIRNEDIGFVRRGQSVKLKFPTFPFQKYGMIEGVVEHVGADAADGGINQGESGRVGQAMVYKALIVLNHAEFELDGERFPLGVGMQTNAEIWLGSRTVMEYLLMPVQKAWHEAARER